jgi:hypothetical protein
MLLARGRASDAPQAWALVQQAHVVADDLGLSTVRRRAGALLATH